MRKLIENIMSITVVTFLVSTLLAFVIGFGRCSYGLATRCPEYYERYQTENCNHNASNDVLGGFLTMIGLSPFLFFLGVGILFIREVLFNPSTTNYVPNSSGNTDSKNNRKRVAKSGSAYKFLKAAYKSNQREPFAPPPRRRKKKSPFKF